VNKLIKKTRYLIEFLRKNGLGGFAKELYYRFFDNYYEKYFGVSTKGFVSIENLGINNPESVDYSPVHYRHIFNMLNKIGIDKSNSTLLEYGCGKGRALITAAAFQYKKIIGVEVSYLVDDAKSNLSKAKHRKTKNIEVNHCDAKDYIVPEEVNVIYFYNPFRGSILENVTKNIFYSFKDSPRKIYIIFFNNEHFDEVIADQDWLNKIDQLNFHFNISCGLYETNL
jgi:SAM-dependent methyltransferase